MIDLDMRLEQRYHPVTNVDRADDLIFIVLQHTRIEIQKRVAEHSDKTASGT